MRNRRRIIIVAGSVVAACALVVAGLFVFRPKPAPVTPASHAQAASPARQLVSLFTGEPVRSLGPVLAVKIDNIVNARPQTGLAGADIVYVLPVEGGLSRFCAIFSSHLPPVVGPVRSARDDDLQLLRQFGRPAFAYSGAQPQLLPVVERARIVDLYAGRVGGYYRDDLRAAPYNLYARTSQLLAEAHGASTARDIGFRFGPAPAGGTVTAARSVSYPAASFTFRWSAGQGRWLVWMDGAPALSGRRLEAPRAVRPPNASWARPPSSSSTPGSVRPASGNGAARPRTPTAPARAGRWCSATGKRGRFTGRARTARTAPRLPRPPGSG